MTDLTPLAGRVLAEVWDKLTRDERQTCFEEVKAFYPYSCLEYGALPFKEAFAVYLCLNWIDHNELKAKLLNYYSKTAIDVSGQKR